MTSLSNQMAPCWPSWGVKTGHETPSGMLVSSLPKQGSLDCLRWVQRICCMNWTGWLKKWTWVFYEWVWIIALIKDNQLTWSSAGMPPYYIYRAATGTTEEIQISGIPLGSFNDVYFDQINTTFNSGDILVIISDGLPEAPNLTGDLFDYQKLQNRMYNLWQFNSQGSHVDQLMLEADAWQSGKHNPDDITLVVIKKIAWC